MIEINSQSPFFTIDNSSPSTHSFINCQMVNSRSFELDKMRCSLDHALLHFHDEIRPISLKLSNCPKESLAEYVRQQVIPIEANEIYDDLWKAERSCEKFMGIVAQGQKRNSWVLLHKEKREIHGCCYTTTKRICRFWPHQSREYHWITRSHSPAHFPFVHQVNETIIHAIISIQPFHSSVPLCVVMSWHRQKRWHVNSPVGELDICLLQARDSLPSFPTLAKQQAQVAFLKKKNEKGRCLSLICSWSIHHSHELRCPNCKSQRNHTYDTDRHPNGYDRDIIKETVHIRWPIRDTKEDLTTGQHDRQEGEDQDRGLEITLKIRSVAGIDVVIEQSSVPEVRALDEIQTVQSQGSVAVSSTQPLVWDLCLEAVYKMAPLLPLHFRLDQQGLLC